MQHSTTETHEQTASGKKKQGTGRAGKAALRAELREESLDELDRLAEEEAELDEDDLEAMELRYREAALKLARAGLARRLAKNRGYRGPRIECGQGHEARFVAYRERTLKTAVGPIAWAPAYYDCAECPEGTPGLTPRDRELGISKDSMSPGLNRMVGRVSSKGPFAEAHEDLLELSGIDVPTKLIERHGGGQRGADRQGHGGGVGRDTRHHCPAGRGTVSG